MDPSKSLLFSMEPHGAAAPAQSALPACKHCNTALDTTTHVPKILPCCFATVCGACVSGACGKCPYDGKALSVDAAGPPTDQQALALVHEHAAARSRDQQVMCLCEQHPASVQCIQCQGEVLCDTCWKTHQKSRLTSSHTCVPVGQLTTASAILPVPCAVHPIFDIAFFCTNDHSLICELCYPLQHSGHKVVALDQATLHINTPKLIAAAQQHSAQLLQAEADVQQTHADVHAQHTQLTADINAHIDALIAALQRRRRKLLDTLDTLCGSKTDALRAQSTALAAARASLDAAAAHMLYLTGKQDHVRSVELSKHVAALVADVQQRGLTMRPCQQPDLVFTHFDTNSAAAAVQQLAGCIADVGCDPQQCTASGDGLTHASVGEATQFTITSKDKHGQQCTRGGMQFAVRIEGSDVQPAVTDHGDGTYGVQYTLPQEGDYRVAVMARGQHIQGSPFNKLPFHRLVLTGMHSRILDVSMVATLTSMLRGNRRRLTLIHDSAGGSTPADFARAVTGKGQILVVVQTDSGQVVGGYVEDEFRDSGKKWISGDVSNFVFSLGNVHGQAVKLMRTQDDPNGVYMNLSKFGLYVGNGGDLCAFSSDGYVYTRTNSYKQPAPGYEHVQVTDHVLTGSHYSPMRAAEVYHCA